MPNNTQTVIDLDRKRMTALAQQDYATPGDILADDLIYVHSSAAVDSKQSFIGNMQSGKTVYMSAEPSGVTAKDLGDTVVLTGVARIQVSSDGTPRPPFGIRFIDVYANRSGKWQMVAWQSTRLPE